MKNYFEISNISQNQKFKSRIKQTFYNKIWMHSQHERVFE